MDARRCEPGFVMDMYLIRTEHDARLAGIKIPKRLASVSEL